MKISFKYLLFFPSFYVSYSCHEGKFLPYDNFRLHYLFQSTIIRDRKNYSINTFETPVRYADQTPFAGGRTYSTFEIRTDECDISDCTLFLFLFSNKSALKLYNSKPTDFYV